MWCGGGIQVALDCGLNVIACVGESLEVREANKTLEVGAELLTTVSGAWQYNSTNVYIVQRHSNRVVCSSAVILCMPRSQGAQQHIRGG